MTAPIKVLLVDDSAVVRQVLSGMLEKFKDIKVIATAGDPIIAQERMKVEWPDVIVLDVEMPRMDGITFLKSLGNSKLRKLLAKCFGAFKFVYLT
jgi:two-component system chemotaxis response regulator CheB